MRGLKIVPLFLVLIILSYVGVIFVQNNPDEMTIHFYGDTESPPLALGFIVLTSALAGMLLAGVLCVLELVVLYIQNKNLRRKLDDIQKGTRPPETIPAVAKPAPTKKPKKEATPPKKESIESKESVPSSTDSPIISAMLADPPKKNKEEPKGNGGSEKDSETSPIEEKPVPKKAKPSPKGSSRSN